MNRSEIIKAILVAAKKMSLEDQIELLHLALIRLPDSALLSLAADAAFVPAAEDDR